MLILFLDKGGLITTTSEVLGKLLPEIVIAGANAAHL